MLNYNEIRPGVAVIVEGEPYVCTWNNVMQKQQRKPVNQTKLRHLIKGNVIEHSFGQSEKLHEAEITTKQALFIYERNEEYWFHPIGKPSERFKVALDIIGEEQAKFYRPNTEVKTHWFEGNIIRIELPIKLTFKVKEAPPNIKGNTAQGGNKIVTLETGADLTVPMFINAGDLIVVNTVEGEYVERA